MNTDDLLKMLDLKPENLPKTTPVSKRVPVLIEQHYDLATDTVSGSVTELSPTALLLDEWDLAKGAELHRSWPSKLAAAVGKDGAADFFAACYLDAPALAKHPLSPRLAEFVKNILELPDHQALRESTRFDVSKSRLAATTLAEQFAKLLADDRGREAKAKLPGGRPKSAAKQQQEADLAVIAAAATAVNEAGEKVDEFEETMSALGCGPGQGSDSQLDVARVARVFDRVKNDERLRRICELAGRFRRLAQGKQRQKTVHGYDDMVGVTVGGDPGKLLTSEIGRLDGGVLELELLDRLSRKRALVREHHGVEKVGKGPVVVCVDESGSMNGEPICNAKAFALALAWVAKHQNRWCCLCGYSGGREGTRLVLPPNAWDQGRLLDWLAHFYGGGTTMDVPLAELPLKWWAGIQAPKGKTDLVLVTDAAVSVPPRIAEPFLAWKKAEQVRCISLVLAHSAGQLERVSDEVHLIPRIGVNVDAVGRCLSI